MSRWSLPLIGLMSVALAGGLVAERTLHGQQQPVVTGIPKETTSYRNVVKQVVPAVVSIEARVKPKVKPMNQPRGRRAPLDNSQMPEEFRRFFDQFGGQVPFQDFSDEGPRVGFGSGFLVDPKGVILTNFHVVGGADQVEVTLSDGRKFQSKEIKGDRKTDLAIVRIESDKSLPFLELGDSGEMEVGDRVLAVGAPFGLTGTVTHGIVSGKGRNGFNMNLYEDFLQTDAAINPGNSGGPLVSLDGRVVGINSAIKSRTGGFQGVGLAVSSNMAKNVMNQLLKEGVVHRGYLGVRIKDLNPDVASRLGVHEHGAIVGLVTENSPAAKAGLQAGDVITAVNGKAVKDSQELRHTIATLPVGKPTELKVVRDSKPLSLKVTLEEQPEDFEAVATRELNTPRQRRDSVHLDKVGVEVSDLTPELAEQLGFSTKAKGALVTNVDRDGAANEAGLRRGVLVTKVDKKPVESARDFRELVDKAALNKGVMLQVQTPDGGTDFVVLKAIEEK